jgi:hypothetical protein
MTVGAAPNSDADIAVDPRKVYTDGLPIGIRYPQMGQARRSLERLNRRGADRPQNGDVRRCPHCGVGIVEFNERFRFNGKMVPAWMCDNPGCSVRQAPARRADPPIGASLVKASKQVRAQALRTIMKSKARIARSRRRHSS